MKRLTSRHSVTFISPHLIVPKVSQKKHKYRPRLLGISRVQMLYVLALTDCHAPGMNLIGWSAWNVSLVLPWDGVGMYQFVLHIIQTSQLLTSQGDFAVLELASSIKYLNKDLPDLWKITLWHSGWSQRPQINQILSGWRDWRPTDKHTFVNCGESRFGCSASTQGEYKDSRVGVQVERDQRDCQGYHRGPGALQDGHGHHKLNVYWSN